MNSAFAGAFGVLMVVTAGGTGGPVVLATLGLAAVAVAVSLLDPRAATVAVLLSIIALALSDPAPLFAAASGLSAATYLVTRHTIGSGTAMLTVPTVAGLLGFTAVGLAATAVALPVNWIPLLAPVLMAAVLIVAAIPLLADERTGTLADPTVETEPQG